MPRLSNSKHELFATYYASTGSNRDELINAYRAAGYKTKDNHVARVNATRLAGKASIAFRVRELQEKVDDAVKMETESIIDKAIQTRVGRIEKISEDLRATDTVIAERAAFPEHQDVPGGKTGRVVTSFAVRGSKRIVDEKGRTTIEPIYYKTHAVDIKLLEERRAMLDQIAQELGQKMDRKQQVPMTVDELKQLPVFEAFLESAFKDAEKAGLLDEPSPEDKEAVEDLLNGKV